MLLKLIFSLFVIISKTSAQYKLPISSACDPLAYPSQCGNNAICASTLPGVCQRGLCMCSSPDFVPLYQNSADCGRLLQPGDPCSPVYDAAAIPDHSQCINGIVICSMNLMNANRSCVAPAPQRRQAGDPCDDYYGCDESLLLRCARPSSMGRRCECVNGLIFKDGRCQPALFGDPCTVDDQCNVVYQDLPDAYRSICYEGRCVCGTSYVRVSAVVRTNPSSTLLRDMTVANVVGSYCFSSLLMPRMIAGTGEYCSVPLPYEPFNPAKIFCIPELTCVHCAESPSLSMGTCRNISIFTPPMPPTTARPTTRAAATTARVTTRPPTTTVRTTARVTTRPPTTTVRTTARVTTRPPTTTVRTTARVTPAVTTARTTARVTGTTARVTGTTARVTGTTARVTGTTARVTGTTARVTGTTARVTGTTARVTGTTARVTGTTARVTGTTARVTPTTPRVTGMTTPMHYNTTSLARSTHSTYSASSILLSTFLLIIFKWAFVSFY